MRALLAQPAIAGMIAFRLVQPPPVRAETTVVTGKCLVTGALPTGPGAFNLAERYGPETGATSGAVLISTILSPVTLSVALALMG